MLQKKGFRFENPSKRISGDIARSCNPLPCLLTNKSVPLILRARSPQNYLQKMATNITNFIETQKQNQEPQCKCCEQLAKLVEILKNQNQNLKKQNAFLLGSIRNQTADFSRELRKLNGEVWQSVEKVKIYREENNLIKKELGSKMQRFQEKLERLKEEDQKLSETKETKETREFKELNQTKDAIRQTPFSRAQSSYNHHRQNNSYIHHTKERSTACSPISIPPQKIKEKLNYLHNQFNQLIQFSHDQRIVDMNRKLVKKKMVEVVTQISQLQISAHTQKDVPTIKNI